MSKSGLPKNLILYGGYGSIIINHDERAHLRFRPKVNLSLFYFILNFFYVFQDWFKSKTNPDFYDWSFYLVIFFFDNKTLFTTVTKIPCEVTSKNPLQYKLLPHLQSLPHCHNEL